MFFKSKEREFFIRICFCCASRFLTNVQILNLEEMKEKYHVFVCVKK